MHTHLYCLALVILGQLTLDLLVFKEFGHFWHGLLQNQFRINCWKLFKFLSRFELSPTLACRKEGIFEHADKAYDTEENEELGEFVVETVSMNFGFEVFGTLGLNFKFFVLKPGANDLLLKLLILKFELFEVEFFPVSGNLS